MDIVTLSPVFVFPSCYVAVVRVRYVGHPHLGTRHDYSGVDSDYGDTDNTDTLPTAGNTRNSPHAKGSMLSKSGRRRLGAGVICRAS